MDLFSILHQDYLKEKMCEREGRKKREKRRSHRRKRKKRKGSVLQLSREHWHGVRQDSV